MRFRRATGIERLQLKWLAYTAVLVPVTLLVCMAGALATGNGDDGDVFTALFFFMLGAIPTSVGVAVLRYRLYDIDRVINRTLVYGVLTLLLAGAYAAITLVLGTGARERLRLADGRGDAARRGRVPAAARAGAGRGRPPLQPRSL